jgi:hypothetical protein
MIRIISYLSRTLSVVIIIFFAFFLTARTSPVFGGNQGLINELLTLIVIGITIAAWRIPMMGGVLFVMFGVRYFVMIAIPGDLSPDLMVLGILVLTGILFMWEGYHTNKGNTPISKKLWFN